MNTIFKCVAMFLPQFCNHVLTEYGRIARRNELHHSHKTISDNGEIRGICCIPDEALEDLERRNDTVTEKIYRVNGSMCDWIDNILKMFVPFNPIDVGWH
jgi:hypothetical protein